MKSNSTLAIIIKIIVIGLIIYYIPSKNSILTKVFEAKVTQTDASQETISQETPISNKKVHIYNTHQGERYVDYDVVSGASYLQENLVQLGYHCDVEHNDFENYKSVHNISYNKSYTVSQMYLQNTLSTNGGYDLIIDFHRDSLPKTNSTIVANNLGYAKIMFVVGQSSGKTESVSNISQALSDRCNQQVPGISKGIYYKKNHYNQGVSDNIVLIEFGGQDNTKEEVQNTIKVVASAIKDYLQ